MKTFIAAILCTLVASSVFASPVQFKSDTKQTTVIELFTSQGCSSCPPAEKWLNSLMDNPGLWTEFIPLAFHVDYWDRLGWKDIYAKPEHTKRQYQYQQNGNVRVVYTPGFFVNGQEWRAWSNWFKWTMPMSDKNVGVLSLDVEDNDIHARYENGMKRALVLNVAVLGFDIKTPVKAGENSGHELPQEFVVLGHSQSVSSNGKWHVQLPNISNEAKKYALVSWVSNANNQAPIQAAGGWLPEGNL
ncbi:MAG: DUF1223 domain-containing protein [Cycloclasticus sp.]